MNQAGVRVIVITNQSGIGRGVITPDILETTHARLRALLAESGGRLDAIYFCPHHPDDGCRCRKPGRGMVDRAVAENQLDLRRSYVIGDRVHDVELAKEIGRHAELIRNFPDHGACHR